jgi:hypothetical protein
MENVKKILISLGYIIIAAIFYFFYEIYNSYYQEVRSSESYRYGKAIGKSISTDYSSNGRYPSNIEKINYGNQISQHVGKVTFNDDGSFHIQLAGDSSEEGVLIFSPEEKDDAQISFSCHSLGVPTEYIPKDCVKEDG